MRSGWRELAEGQIREFAQGGILAREPPAVDAAAVLSASPAESPASRWTLQPHWHANSVIHPSSNPTSLQSSGFRAVRIPTTSHCPA
jgi:hypothetical protein